MGVSLHFFVPGVARPQGSKRLGFHKTKTGETRSFVLDNNDKALESWRGAVAQAARAARAAQPLIEGAVFLELEFTFLRPKGHFGTGGNATTLKRSAPAYHVQRPDIDKLKRAVMDALSGVVWRDDSQVCQGSQRKVWGDCAGVRVEVLELPPMVAVAPARAVEAPGLFDELEGGLP